MAYQTIYPYTNEVLRSYESLSDAGVEKALEQAYGQYQAWQKDNDIETSESSPAPGGCPAPAGFGPVCRNHDQRHGKTVWGSPGRSGALCRYR